MSTNDRTPEQVLKIVAACTFQPFSQHDWDSWAGCESENPLIGNIQDPDNPAIPLIVILDGSCVSIVDASPEKEGMGEDEQMYWLRSAD
jgi:hypothetical protein